jgi:hypothetical protein
MNTKIAAILATVGVVLGGCDWAPAQGVGPYVVMPGQQTTPPVTAYAATAAVATNAINGLTPFETSWMTNQITEWWSADTIGATNGQIVNSWMGRYGNALTGNCTYVSQVPGLGHPGVFFDSSGSMVMSNNTLLGFNFTNSGTILCVYTFPPSSYDGNQHLVFCGNTQHSATNLEYTATYPGDQSFYDSPPSLQSVDTGLGVSINTQDSEAIAWSQDTVVYLLSWSPTNDYAYYNGKCFYDWPLGQAVGGLSGPMGFSGVLSLGLLSNPYGFWPMHGYIEEFLVSSNFWSTRTADAANNYIMRKYGLLKDQIILLGDSLPSGAKATWNGGWASLLASNYPGWQIVNAAASGTTTGMAETNSWVTALTSTMPGRKIAILWNSLINDSSLGLGVITNAQNLIAGTFQTNGIPLILTIPPSSFAADTTFYNNGGTLGNQTLNVGYRSLYTNGWSNYYAAIIPLWEDPNVGPSNMWTNLVTYGPGQDGKHLTNAGYAETFPYVQAAINYVLDPANLNFTGTTNQPPPWNGVGWNLTYQGHLYNSLGSNSWTLIR